MQVQLEDVTPHKGSRRKTQLASGYESDSDGQDLGDDSDESDKEDEADDVTSQKSANCESEKIKESDDDMFASEDEDAEPQPQPHARPAKSKSEFDIDQFEKDQGLDTYEFDENADREPNIQENAQEVQLEAFNLREEAESGKFDKDMNYIGGKDSSDEEEPWMVDANNEEIKKARLAQQKANEQTKKGHFETRPVSEILVDLITYLEPAESAMEALGRLRPKKTKKGGKKVDLVENDIVRKKRVIEITECCEQLINDKGVASAYDMSREELMRAYTQETGETFQARGTKRNASEMETGTNDYGEAIWEFRWEGEDAANGPYSSYEMKYWKETYFEDKVEVRRVGEPEYVHVTKVDFDE